MSIVIVSPLNPNISPQTPISRVIKVYFWGGMAAKHAVARFAANENDDENDNFHIDVNCQFSIVTCQFAALQHCHATPKINFFHLEKIVMAGGGVNKLSIVFP